MPWGDRTGPLGRGPKTGRGLGWCNGYEMPRQIRRGFGRGITVNSTDKETEGKLEKNT